DADADADSAENRNPHSTDAKQPDGDDARPLPRPLPEQDNGCTICGKKKSAPRNMILYCDACNQRKWLLSLCVYFEIYFVCVCLSVYVCVELVDAMQSTIKNVSV